VAAVIATPDDAQRRRARQAEAIVNANKSLCRTEFGKANVAVAGASLLIGLPPEAMDQGAPAREEAPAE